MDTVLARGDQVVAISNDDDTVLFNGVPEPREYATTRPPATVPRSEHVLVLGWNEMGPHLIRELDAYAVAGSSVTVLADVALARPDPAAHAGSLEVEVVDGDTTDEELVASLVARRRPDHVVVLCYHGLPVAEADARTLLSLLELRHIFGGAPHVTPPTVVAELLDVEDVTLAPVTAADDFVVSEKLTSYVLTQLSENPELAQVFDELLGAGGCEVSIQRAADHLPAGPVSYREVVARFRSYGDVVVGYRTKEADGRAGPVVINPPKTARLDVTPLTEVITLVRPPLPHAPPPRKRAPRKARARAAA
jgi:hypothetical protein